MCIKDLLRLIVDHLRLKRVVVIEVKGCSLLIDSKIVGDHLTISALIVA